MDSPDGQGDAVVQPAPGRPQLIITWPASGGAGAELALAGAVTLGQLMEAAFLLDCVARENRAAAVQRSAMASLIPATAGMLDSLRRT